MKSILILYPHFPPSNLAGVHRPRLFAQHLPSFGWEPIILTVHERYYEEELDYNLERLLPATLRIEKVKAFNMTKPRFIGDIGLRGFWQLYKRAKEIIMKENIDLLYIPIPSFYCALLGRLLHSSTGVKYGIDYIDPWVHHFPGSERIFSRHWFSNKLAKLLEPVAIKKALLITGVAEGYYRPVLERNPHLLQKAVVGAMPYGGEKADHEKLRDLNIVPYLFKRDKDKIKLMYAGAMLPKAYKPLEAIFKSIRQYPETFGNIEFIFVGTGKRTDDPTSYTIRPLAEQYGLWEKVIFEHPRRIPYMDVLTHLDVADGVFILGSTEPHYTPSKVYQGVLSEKPILAVLHSDSSATKVIRTSGVGLVLDFDGEDDIDKISGTFENLFKDYLLYMKHYSVSNLNTKVFEQYSAYSVTSTLAGLLNKAIQQKD